ncbi:MAG: hypothetical protein KDC08_13880, partial [Actinobacteria bacterium]|nr:hypothetical protein [Actinomycetota bacterium]
MLQAFAGHDGDQEFAAATAERQFTQLATATLANAGGFFGWATGENLRQLTRQSLVTPLTLRLH